MKVFKFREFVTNNQSRKGITDFCYHPVSDMIFEMVGLRLPFAFFLNLYLQIHWLTDIWEIPRSEIVLGKELGTGQFGVSEP